MRKTALLLAALLLITFHLGCQNDESTPVRPVMEADKMPPVPECLLAAELTQEFLEALWLEAEAVNPRELETIEFTVPVGEEFSQISDLKTYADRRYKVGLHVPPNAIPDLGGTEVIVQVHIPRGDLQKLASDGGGVSITFDGDQPTVLNQAITVTVPVFPWYEEGWEMAFFFLDHDENATPQYTYQGLQCWTVESGMYNVSLPVWYLDTHRPDVGGTTTWSSEPVDPDEGDEDD